MLTRPSAPNLPLGRSRMLRVLGDEKLIALVRQGNEAAFEVLVRRYEAKLLAFCRHLLRSNEDAEDVMQDVLARAYRGIRAHDREIAAKPWLYRIARNCCLDHLGRSRPGQELIDELEIEGAHGTAADQVEQRERLEQVISDIHDLPETQRTALTMRELGDLSYEQVAAAMDTTVPAIKSLLVRARMSLAEAAEARSLPCGEVRADIERGGRLSGASRRHANACELCATAARRARKRPAAAALLPLLPIGLIRRVGELFGFAPGGGGGDAVANGVAGAKVAVIATAAIATAAPQVAHHAQHHPKPPVVQAAAPAPARVTAHPPPAPAPPVSRPQPQPVQPPVESTPVAPAPQPPPAVPAPDAGATEPQPAADGSPNDQPDAPPESTPNAVGGEPQATVATPARPVNESATPAAVTDG